MAAVINNPDDVPLELLLEIISELPFAQHPQLGAKISATYHRQCLLIPDGDTTIRQIAEDRGFPWNKFGRYVFFNNILPESFDIEEFLTPEKMKELVNMHIQFRNNAGAVHNVPQQPLVQDTTQPLEGIYLVPTGLLEHHNIDPPQASNLCARYIYHERPNDLYRLYINKHNGNMRMLRKTPKRTIDGGWRFVFNNGPNVNPRSMSRAQFGYLVCRNNGNNDLPTYVTRDGVMRPITIDHKDGNRGNDDASNHRPADGPMQARNNPRMRALAAQHAVDTANALDLDLNDQDDQNEVVAEIRGGGDGDEDSDGDMVSDTGGGIIAHPPTPQPEETRYSQKFEIQVMGGYFSGTMEGNRRKMVFIPQQIEKSRRHSKPRCHSKKKPMRYKRRLPEGGHEIIEE